MTEKLLGKIVSAEYGMVRDKEFLFGLQLHFKMGGCAIGDGYRYCENISDNCEWKNSNREEAITKSVDKVNEILKEAKCKWVSELIGKPVEVTIEDSLFKDFRILTEVL